MRRKLLRLDRMYRLRTGEVGRIISITTSRLPSDKGSMLPAVKMRVRTPNSLEVRNVFLIDIISEAVEMTPEVKQRARAKTIKFSVDYIGSHEGCGGDVNLVSSSTGGTRLCAGCGATGEDAGLKQTAKTDVDQPISVGRT